MRGFRIAALLAVALGAAAALIWRAGAAPAMTADATEPPLGSPDACANYAGLPPGWPQAPHAGMRWIDAGEVQFGSARGYADERPVVDERVAGFWIDRTEVTNAQFEHFVNATGYVTTAERDGAAIFTVPAAPVAEGHWWRLEADASWRQPEGPGSDLAGRANHPVVNLSHADASAYAAWLGRELPSELEWEFAAKAGRSNEAADAALRDAQRRPLANFWQGLFPYDDRAEDGHAGRAPVGCFPANPNGLHDMIGNVWEWTRDAWAVRGEAPPADGIARFVIKGGSYLCSADYCMRARASSRQGQEADLPTGHVGFRTMLRR